MLDPHRLTVFRAVVASGSVQAAADNLGLTSSAVSQHLAALQRETGLTLFQRSGRGIVPTEAALVLDARSDEPMSQWDRLERVVADLRDGRAGQLSIGYFASAGSAWMPQLVARLRAEYPDLVLELRLNEVEQRGPRPDLDLVIDPPGAPVPAGLRRVELTVDPFVAVLPREHPLAGAERIALTDLRGETWVSNDHPSSVGHRILVAACAAVGLRPRFSVQAQDHHTAIGFVAAGVGVSVMPGLAARALPAGVARVEIAPPAPVRHLSAVVRPLGGSAAPVERAVQLLEELIARPERTAGDPYGSPAGVG
ncbi:LysR family transcriptional regulator [Phycicoccus endophyticus]|uniref:LysR family transcriptional regulator n=1 Tax=Phycicoccus endophyticus TaxID=1690220 RepID=A0A7G9R0F6_9MICO|nr:LysR family transcriptional regulator [Phycicoccus endophyticus]NHI20103.1 LysR family transcriptional regulator [Phycicoccus endophyticus]QNN49081.1 LysR family transcriptional regulator [Phycicoccus endophyticus]GGL38426.1 LysR family transcriptional regulator [Phycicoccus endophyticus]